MIEFDGKTGPPETGQLFHWDPLLVAELRARGARVPDFVAQIDDYIETMGQLPDERVAEDYQKMKRFYFDHVDDPLREGAFRERVNGVASDTVQKNK